MPGLGADAGGGSGFMMLTGGIESDVGKSAVVGLPVGTASGMAGSAPSTGATAPPPQVSMWRPTSES